MEADKDGDGKLSFEEFTQMVSNTVRASFPHPRRSMIDRDSRSVSQDIEKQMTLEDLF